MGERGLIPDFDLGPEATAALKERLAGTSVDPVTGDATRLPHPAAHLTLPARRRRTRRASSRILRCRPTEPSPSPVSATSSVVLFGLKAVLGHVLHAAKSSGSTWIPWPARCA